MKKIGYVLGAISFVWLFAIGGADFPAPFFKHALIILAGVALGVNGLFFSVWLISKAEQKEKEDYPPLNRGAKKNLRRNGHGIVCF